MLRPLSCSTDTWATHTCGVHIRIQLLPILIPLKKITASFPELVKMFTCISVTSHCCFGVIPPADVAVSEDNEVWTVWAVKLEGFLLLLLLQAEVVAWVSCEG